MEKKKVKKSKKFKIIAIVFIVLAVIIAVPYFYFNYQVGKVKTVSIPTSSKDLGINENIFKPKANTDDYVNILLFGVDTRDVQNKKGSADSIMILTVDKFNKKMKLTSIMRDSIVDMQGRGEMQGFNQDRINYSFDYGGAPLTIKTINENYQMNIKDYVKVDFVAMAKLIDAVGGVPVNITAEEIPVANSYIKEISKIEKTTPNYIKTPGLQTLNGVQAVGYCRIRYVGNMDFERTQRQRTVLTELFKKLSKTSLLDMPKLADTILPNVETSLDKSDILSLASYILMNKISNIEQLRLPIEGSYRTIYVNNVYFLGWDKDTNIKKLHEFVFEGQNIDK
ncbi:LCP family protein [Inconstantimicrobium mannanitabidum]|uniref:LytR family transcriptional regulator n=1 Tax=Inconstantimicrobium mannanitabidum TaxID=1604901 RepID=A0ACB5RFN0_9CLOT|nr:LCP family protein [Clostridium sp. TW13]GKX67901.1 LytR family transcriptional regulator [Clostridium sp. TW13]